MANYGVIVCFEEVSYNVVVDFPVIVGDVIDFLIGENRYCGTITGPAFRVDGPIALNVYESCEECLNPDSNPPRSANTEVFVCQEICVSGGTTTLSITPPHPVWTDGYGTPVTQLNMITLGGIDGLNN